MDTVQAADTADRRRARSSTTGARGWWVTRGVATALPGDLTVWDGYVAMVVGNGMMIEARYR